jgi:transposase-like protein
MDCPNCKTTHKQVKAGKNASGSQRYRCKICGKKYTPLRTQSRYPLEFHEQAVRLYLAGMSFRAIGRLLKVNHQSVINWIETYASQSAQAKARLVHRIPGKLP